MTRRTCTGMAAAAAMALILATGSASADSGVEIQRNDGPSADSTGNLMYDLSGSGERTHIQSTELDRRGGSDGGADTPTVILTMDPVRAERGWLCQVLETAVGDFVSIGLMCN